MKNQESAWKTAEEKFRQIFAEVITQPQDLETAWTATRAAFINAQPSKATPEAMKKFMENLVLSVAEMETFFNGLANLENKYSVTCPSKFLDLLDPRDGEEFNASVKNTPLAFVGIAKGQIKCWFANIEIPEAEGEQSPKSTAKITDFPEVREVSCQFPTEDQWKAAFALRDKSKIADMDPSNPGNGEYLEDGTVIGESKQAVERGKNEKWNEAAMVPKNRIAITIVPPKGKEYAKTDLDKEVISYRILKGEPEALAMMTAIGDNDRKSAKNRLMQRENSKNPEGTPKGTPETFSYRYVIERDAMKKAITAPTPTPP